MDNALIENNISFLREYIPKLITAIEHEAELLIKNEEQLAFDLLENIMEGLEWTIRSISSIEKVGYIKDLKLNEIAGTVQELEKTFYKKDFVLLSDLLQYELVEVLVYWQDKLNDVN